MRNVKKNYEPKYETKLWKPFQGENYRDVWYDKKLLGVIREFFRDLRYAHQRIRRGYCDRDIYSIYDWFLGIMPTMLEQFRDDLHGCPSMPGSIAQRLVLDKEDKESDDMDDMKEWVGVLNRMIFLLREADEESCSRKNPYAEEYLLVRKEFYKKYGLLDEKMNSADENSQTGSTTQVHFPEELEEYRYLGESYMKAERELAQYRTDCKDKALSLFATWFYDLWD